MKNLKKIIVLIFLLKFQFVFSHHDKTVVGEFCYYEQINGQKSTGEAMPYVYHDKLELKFQSGYQITINDKVSLSKLIKKYNTKNTTTKVLLGSYKPELISFNTKIIDSEKSINIYWDGKKIIFEIPELVDMFSSNKASNHSIFVPKSCINSLIDCLK